MHMLRAMQRLIVMTGLVLVASCDPGGTGPDEDPGTLSVGVSPDVADVVPGQTATLQVTVTRGGGFSGAVSLSLEGAPSGISGSFAPGPVSGTVSTLTVQAAAGAAPGTYTLTVRAAGSGVSAATATFTLTVLEPPGISVAAAPAALGLNRGGSASTTLTLTRTNFTEAVQLTLEGAPTGVTGTFAPATLAGSTNTSTLTIDAAAGAALGAANLIVRARGAGVTDATAALTVAISQQPAFTLALTPAAMTLQQGAGGDVAIGIARVNFTGAVTLSVSGAPAGVTANITPVTTTDTAATLSLTVAGDAAPGSYTLRVTAQAQGMTDRTADLVLTITPASGYTLAVAPTALTLQQGASGTANVTLARTSFSDVVAIAVSGMPAGVTATVTPATTAGNAAILTVNVGAGAAPGTYALTITGQATGAADRTATLDLTVTAAPAIVTVAATDPSASESGANTGTFTITRTGSTAAALSVNFTLGGSATNGTDYAAVASPVTIPAGQASVAITITPVADGVTEGDENVTLTLAPGNYQIGTPSSATIVIADENAGGGTLTNGAHHFGTISLPGELDTWTFTGTQGESVFLSLAELAPFTDFVPWLRLNAPDGSQVTFATGQLVAQISVRLNQTGTYTVIVGTADGGNDATSAYELVYIKAPGTITVPTGDQGGALTSGANHAGAVHLGDLDAWTFDGTQNESVFLSLAEQSPMTDFNPWLRLIAPDGSQVTFSTGQLVAQISVRLNQTGRYTVIVGTADGGNDAESDYLLTFIQAPGSLVVPDGDDGGALTSGLNHPGRIVMGDLDAWTFDGTQNESVFLSLAEQSPMTDFNPWLRLIAPDGSQVTFSTGQLVAQISVRLNQTGRYTVIVGTADGGNDAESDYLLTFIQAPGPLVVPDGDDGGALSSGLNHPGRIVMGDLDAWTFDGTQNESVFLSLAEQSPITDFNPWLRLIAPDGSQVTFSTGQLVAQISVRLNQTGRYTVIVGTADGGNDAESDYLLTFIKVPGSFAVPAGDEGGALPNNAGRNGTITMGDLDPWSFAGVQGEAVTITMTELEPLTDFNPWIRLIAPDGSQVTFATGTVTASINVTLQQTGTYVVIAGTADGGNDATSDYVITLTRGGGGGRQ